MRENRDSVVPVNILTPFARTRFLGSHDTPPCVLIMRKVHDPDLKIFIMKPLLHINNSL